MAHIRQRGKNSYLFKVSAGLGADGKYKYKYKTYRVTEKMTPKQLEAHLEHEAYKFEQKVRSDAYIAPAEMTFKQFSKEWREKWMEKNLSENTIALRIGHLNNHILPVIGHINMKKVTTMMLLDLMENLTRKDGRKGDLSVSSKQEIHKLLTSIFNRAVDWKVLSDNPMDGIELPRESKEKSKELNVYDLAEVELLIRALEDELIHWRIFVLLSIATGMRRGELLGLEWKHVDLNNKTVNVEQIISRTRKGYEVKPPKYNSIRMVSLPESVAYELKEYKQHCLEEKMQLQHKWTETQRDWLFFNENGGHFKTDTPTQWWNRFLERINLRHIRLHDLRHTSATLLIAQNVHPKIISERLGHKKISTTMDIYGHALPAVDREASSKLNDILSL